MTHPPHSHNHPNVISIMLVPFRVSGPATLHPLSVAAFKTFFDGADAKDRTSRGVQYGLRALNGYYTKLAAADPGRQEALDNIRKAFMNLLHVRCTASLKPFTAPLWM